MKFFLSKAPPPDPKKLPNDSDVDVSVILLLALYRNQEFARVGYYVFTEYDDPELRENPPVKVDFEKVGLIEIRL
jgi:histone chaperone ASF1